MAIDLIRTPARFLAIVANGDASLVGVPLEEAFRFRVRPIEDIARRLSNKEHFPQPLVKDILNELYHATIDGGRSVLVVEGSTWVWTVKPDEYGRLHWKQWARIYASELLPSTIVNNVISRLRLFKEGNLAVPEWYIYRGDIRTVAPHAFVRSLAVMREERFELSVTERRNAVRFLKQFNVPFALPYIELANRNFQESYAVTDDKLRFLQLMIGLEVLLNDSHQELRYRVARNAAVLLGRSRSESEECFGAVKKLYDLRSKVVHTGDATALKPEDVTSLRAVLRRCVVAAARLALPKDGLLRELGANGFGGLKMRRPSTA